jgi:serine/threonine protein kinase/Tol biopolymer transport system component
MTLIAGSRLGPYEVLAKLGEGGMGVVYRARDTRLNRDIALKVLPDGFATDTDRLARFRREAQLLASLNHQNIAAIHGLEEDAALVLELIEGPTLADRLVSGALPIDEALQIARQVAQALEAAHERGIVHRDLKPANIKVRDDGTVKVLDFGLARAFEGDPAQISGVSLSPTLTSPAMTGAGVILGTAAYMAPEQARGKVVDKRADIWAFGVVLFEMLAGRRLFASDDVSDTLAFVLTKDPDWTALPPSTPPALRRLLRRCLEKDRSRRLADVADARLDIEDALHDLASGSTMPAQVVEPDRQAMWRRALPWTVAGTAVVALTATLVLWSPWRDALLPAVVRVQIDLGANAVLSALSPPIALSPDGTTLAVVARPLNILSTQNQLYVRRLDRLDSQPLSGTEGAAAPFFSPDGEWVAFFADGSLKKVPAVGGAVVVICAVASPRGGSWAADNTIVFASPDGLSRVPAAGGQVERISQVQKGGAVPATPQILPGGKAVMYLDAVSTVDSTKSGAVVVRPLPSGEPRVVLRGGGTMPRYIETGHLTIARGGTLFAVPFDVERLETHGNLVPVADNIATIPAGGAVAATSVKGLLVYQPRAGSSVAQGPVVWLDRTGATTPLRATPSLWGFPRFSPDGKRLALAIDDGRQIDIWVYEWERDILTRVTSDPAADIAPVWTPDGTRIAFASSRGGNVSNIYWQRADGTGDAQRLTDGPISQLPNAFHPDGRHLAFHQGDPSTGRQEIGVLPIEGDDASGWKTGTPEILVGGPFLKANARFSPDGRWFSYSSFVSGRFEIYVQPYPGPGSRVQISSDGGNLGLWSPTKNEIYYAGNQQQRMMVAPYTIAGNVFTPSKAVPWTEARFSMAPPIAAFGPGFDLHPSGLRFAVSPASPQTNATVQRPSTLVLVFNLFDELRRQARH